MALNHTPDEFGEQLSQHGYLGHAAAPRTLRRSRPVWLDFAELPMWTDDKKPWF